MYYEISILTSIIKDYPEIWTETRRFKAVLADLMYGEDNRIKRNLLGFSVEKKIPQKILSLDAPISEFDIYRISSQMYKEFPIPEKKTIELVVIWDLVLEKTFGFDIDALNRVTVYHLFLEDEISNKLYCYLKKIGIKTLGDLINSELYFGLSQGIAPFEEELSKLLGKYGKTELKKKRYKTFADIKIDDLELTGRSKKALRKIGAVNVHSIVALFHADNIGNVQNIGKMSASKIKECLMKVGIPEICLLPVILYNPTNIELKDKKMYSERLIPLKETNIPNDIIKDLEKMGCKTLGDLKNADTLYFSDLYSKNSGKFLALVEGLKGYSICDLMMQNIRKESRLLSEKMHDSVNRYKVLDERLGKNSNYLEIAQEFNNMIESFPNYSIFNNLVLNISIKTGVLYIMAGHCKQTENPMETASIGYRILLKCIKQINTIAENEDLVLLFLGVVLYYTDYGNVQSVNNEIDIITNRILCVMGDKEKLTIFEKEVLESIRILMETGRVQWFYEKEIFELKVCPNIAYAKEIRSILRL